MSISDEASAENLPKSERRRIKRFEPVQLGKIMGLVYGLMSLVAVPFFLLFAMISSAAPGAKAFPFGVVVILFLPIIYAAMGFIFGIIGAFVYNLCAKFVGGIEVDVETGVEVLS